jgi:hypothetical protein
MKYVSILIGFLILVDSCTLPVSVEEINVNAECENTKLVKSLLKDISYTQIYIGQEYIGTYSEFKVVDNYIIVTDDFDNKARYNLCAMIGASVSGYHLRIRF